MKQYISAFVYIKHTVYYHLFFQIEIYKYWRKPEADLLEHTVSIYLEEPCCYFSVPLSINNRLMLILRTEFLCNKVSIQNVKLLTGIHLQSEAPGKHNEKQKQN